jgi:hypothetical protein
MSHRGSGDPKPTIAELAEHTPPEMAQAPRLPKGPAHEHHRHHLNTRIPHLTAS